MNTSPLTGVRKALFLAIAQNPSVSKQKLCAYSRFRGGDLTRIGHHLIGLESEGFIFIVSTGKGGNWKYKITSGKGIRMLEALRKMSDAL